MPPVPTAVPSAAANRNSAVSTPSRSTAKKAIAASAAPPSKQRHVDLVVQLGALMPAPCRRIQKIIHVRTPTAVRVTRPPKSCSAVPSNSAPTVKIVAPAARERDRREARAPPDDPRAVRAAELPKVREQDRDDERGFDPLPERDDEGGTHATP